MKRIRVLVVEDSLTMRQRLIETLSADPALEVVGESTNGEQATSMCQELRPDVITLDMVLPGLDGVQVTESIMALCPTPILIISGSFNRGEVFKTYDALAAGALEVLEKPRGTEPEGEWERSLLNLVKLVSRIKVITHLRGRQRGTGWHATALESSALPRGDHGRVVVIGTSTGGPGALTAVLKGLGKGFPWPILVVIHIGAPFSEAFVSWLKDQVQMPINHAQDGMLLAEHTGSVLMAPPEHHLSVVLGRVRLTESEPVHSCRPSVDVLFHAAAQDLGNRGVGCLLTGMGKDGALGLLAMRKAGGLTIAQDESTSVVFGMPREAILLGGAERVLPLDQIGPHLLQLASRPRSPA